MDEEVVLEDLPPAVVADLEDDAAGLPRLASPSIHDSPRGGGIGFGTSLRYRSTDNSSNPDSDGDDVGPDPPPMGAPAVPVCNPGDATSHSSAVHPVEPLVPYSELSEGSAPESFIRRDPDCESRPTDSSGYENDGSGYYTPDSGA
ncbi:hypothetical protein LPJ61_005250, partial [Coemansia biformis]